MLSERWRQIAPEALESFEIGLALEPMMDGVLFVRPFLPAVKQKSAF